jgi:hypothetical protein
MKIYFFGLCLLAASLGAACQPTTGNTNSNLSSVNANLTTTANTFANNSANANFALTNSSSSGSESAVDTKEPEKYQATVKLSVETSGAQKSPLPSLKADVARNGDERRMEFALPSGEKLIYLDRGGRQLLISPSRKQFAELNKDALGFEVRRLLMPEQIVNQLKNMKGVERVGEEKMDGRDVVKYRFSGTTNTQTQAGKVDTESFILVDKETGLPLRSVTNASSQGNVQGVQAVNIVTEMSNIRPDVDESLFVEPTDYKQVAPEEIRSQVNALFSVAVAFLGQMMKNAQPANSPAANMTATPTP